MISLNLPTKGLRSAVAIGVFGVFILSSIGVATAQSPASSTERRTQRWLVQLDQRSFTLDALRDAIVTRRDSALATALVEGHRRQILDDHAAFTAAAKATGAEVLRHWWMIDACHVEASEAAIVAIRELEGVIRVDPDEGAVGHNLSGTPRPLDRFNHGTAFGHSIGLDGVSLNGALLAIVDSGLESNVGISGRPHRAFFRNGDPAQSSGGIAGSRIAFGTQFGNLPADDTHGHGTSVGAIAGGAAWGSANAVDGHAKGAMLANYGIGDTIGTYGEIIANFSSMVSAWQQMLTDIANGQNIVVANLSFGGPQDPLHPTQRALDTLAMVGDVLVCVSAGNSGPSPSTGGQSCVNGLAVGAVVEDTHSMENSSSRGPVLGDAMRTYPDIAAVSWARVPQIGCETVDGLFGGTSAAAARIAGAAMVLRGSVPTLTAVESKAILLAASLDLSTPNPGAGANDFGVGLLRDDRALITSAASLRHGDARIPQAGQTKDATFAADPGVNYRIAIAWMRNDVNSTAWSDLNLELRDAATNAIIGTSMSPRNLYETIDFVGPPSGAVRAQVRVVSREAGLLRYGVAITRHPGTPVRGHFKSIGDGCEGPAQNGDPVCVSVNGGARSEDLFGLPFSNRFENAFQMRAPASGLTLTGFELYARGSGAETLGTAVYLGGSAPQINATATGTMVIDADARWYRTALSNPVVIAPNANFWVSIDGWSRTTASLRSPSGRTNVRTFFRDRCVAGGGNPNAWGGSFLDRFGIRCICTGPSVGEVPVHTIRNLPQLGQFSFLEVDRLPPGRSAIAIVGFSSQTWGAQSLPLPLDFIGGAGCSLRVAPFLSDIAVTDSAGHASVRMRISANPSLQGFQFFSQFLILDGTSPRAVTVSNAGQSTIGSF